MKFFKGKKKQIKQEPPVPRTIDELKAAAAELHKKLGETQYLASVYGSEVNTIIGYLREVNAEAAARNELDAKAKPAQSEAV